VVNQPAVNSPVAEPEVVSYSVVIPTIGRDCLARCLTALAQAEGPEPDAVVVVDDRPGQPPALDAAAAGLPVTVLRSGGRGPAAARNAGWRAAASPWIAFLDDDVVIRPDWRRRLAEDLAGQPARVGGVQGRISVPRPKGRKPTDAERATIGLAGAPWITADMAIRRPALVEAGGFDERFRRAFREDSDLALRLLGDGWQLRLGSRVTEHPLRPASPWLSVRAQAGNADDALMRALHGQDWQRRAGAEPGRRRAHAAITAAAGLAVALRVAALARPGSRLPSRAAAAAACASLAGVAEFACARMSAGPAAPAELATMAVTSLAIPPAATWHWVRGWWRARGAPAWPPPPKAVLFDRDGTLIQDVPYNGDPAAVRPMPGARAAVGYVLAMGMQTGLVTNQSGIGRGLLTGAAVTAVNENVARLLGPFGTVQVCPHAPGDGCGCRKPAPGLVTRAAAALGMPPHECAVIGDIGADVQAAWAAGARAVLVPTPATLAAEQAGVRCARDIMTAVLALTGHAPLPPVWPGDDGKGAGQ
jgi:histidinol-phosphate phosphatase family protein